MGYWLSYLGGGFGDVPLPYFDASAELLFSRPVVVASLLVPGLAIAGLVWTRRWRYAPFFLLLLLAGLLVMTVGFPERDPVPARRHGRVQPRRADPVPAHHLQGGAARRARPRVSRRSGRRRAVAKAAGPGAAHGRRRGRGRAGVRRLVAARHRPRGRSQVRLRRGAGCLGARCRPGRRPAGLERARPHPARAALRLLRLGRDRRPDPARAGRAAGRLEDGGAVLGSARRRRAVDRRRRHPAGAFRSRRSSSRCSPGSAWARWSTGTDDDIDRSGAPPPAEAARALALAGLGRACRAVRAGGVCTQPAAGSITAPAPRCRRCASYDSRGCRPGQG